MGEPRDIAVLEAAGVKTPANLAVYVDTLGIDLAMDLFLVAGGSQIYLSPKSSDRALVARTVGAENASRLAEAVGQNYIKVPIARQWVARVHWSRGTSVNEIARTVRADIATVRRWLGPAPRERLKQIQMSLFVEDTDAPASTD
ncbi:helix-turn-helix domain containing protein [Devosia sp.]|uniref:helix-turn-helix domain containing protein n=1 Tax=Devosia sp. TaxID=1871048 RepID=UPI001AC32BE7|nr:helix-turn-helix domain containing protein [Devosia sp.]MBN9333880.1 helix-turn-helix domain containing protein [Devosia sp.]